MGGRKTVASGELCAFPPANLIHKEKTMSNQPTPAGEEQKENSQKKPFYKKWWFITIAVIFVLSAIIGSSEDKKEEAQKLSQPEEQSLAQTKASEEKSEPKEEIKEEVIEAPVEPFEIEVSSQMIKKVDKKYRYFFDVRNNDTKEFIGEVTITLHNDQQKSALGKDTFETTSAISPSLGKSVYFDINTGPVSAHGEYGITKFKYEVRIDGNIVKSGEEVISSKLEDLSMF